MTLIVDKSADNLKQLLGMHWESEVCGSRYGEGAAGDRTKFFADIDRFRYELEPTLMQY